MMMMEGPIQSLTRWVNSTSNPTLLNKESFVVGAVISMSYSPGMKIIQECVVANIENIGEKIMTILKISGKKMKIELRTQECLLEREIAALKRELHGARGLAEAERQTVRLYVCEYFKYLYFYLTLSLCFF